MQTKEKVAIIGSGNWGSAIAKIIGRNVLTKDTFDPEVRMWVFEEVVDGRNLTEIINTEHENVKYLQVRIFANDVVSARSSKWAPAGQGIKFTDNIVADPDLTHACEGATMLVFVLPHQVQ